MHDSPTRRRWFLGTFWAVIALSLAVTVVVLWPTVHKWWVIRSLIQELIAAELNDDANKRVDTYKKLTAIGAPAVPALLKLMRHSNPDVRYAAITPLALMKEGVDDAVPVLIEASRHDEAEAVRARSCWMLGCHGSAANGTVAALINAMNDESANVRGCAIGALALIGRDAESAVPALRQRLHDESTDVRLRALVVLRDLSAISEAESMDLLREWRDSGSEDLRNLVDRILQELSPPVESAMDGAESAMPRP